MKCIKCRMPKTPRCTFASGPNLQFANHHAVLTHNPGHPGSQLHRDESAFEYYAFCIYFSELMCINTLIYGYYIDWDRCMSKRFIVQGTTLWSMSNCMHPTYNTLQEQLQYVFDQISQLYTENSQPESVFLNDFYWENYKKNVQYKVNSPTLNL